MQRRSEITQTCNVIHELVYFNRILCTNKKLIDFTHCILIVTNNATYMYSSVIEQKPNSLNLNKRMYHLKKNRHYLSESLGKKIKSPCNAAKNI